MTIEKWLVPNEKDTASQIIDIVCTYYNLSWEQVSQVCRKREYAEPRQVCMFFLYYYSGMTLKGIGAKFNGKDHTTVVHSRKTIIELSKNNEGVKKDVEKLADYVHRLTVLKQNVFIKPKPAKIKKPKNQHKSGITVRRVVSRVNLPEVLKQRPPAEYSNTGFINLTKKLQAI